jgi:UDP-2,3-diacylglucosamine pyrophosphatase LpxH
MVMPRTLVLGDLHLTRHTPRVVTDDLARLLRGHGGARVVIAGDLFDLSADDPRARRDHAVERAIAAHPDARAALADHVDRGGELWLVGGNHDAEVGVQGFDGTLADALGLAHEARARVRTTPWFFRDGAVHVEHGHLYDPDNAPAHPLVQGEASLGVHFVEEFIAPTGAHKYLNANDGTPLKLFLSSFSWYGKRAPYVIYRYFHAAFGALLRSGPLYRASHEVAEGHARVEDFVRAFDVPKELVEGLLAIGAQPTLESVSRTFTRLYLDRVAATLAIAGGLGAIGLGHGRAGATVLGMGALLMGASWARGHDRYAGTVADHLSRAATRIAETTDAKLVVFGHTHREALDASYANTASFAFPREAPGRPYLEIVGSRAAPRAERRYLSPAA